MTEINNLFTVTALIKDMKSLFPFWCYLATNNKKQQQNITYKSFHANLGLYLHKLEKNFSVQGCELNYFIM